MMYLKQKIEAGADYVVTQLFYDTDLFIDWVARCRDYGAFIIAVFIIGIHVPIVAGIMPIQNYGGFKRMTQMCKTVVPQSILDVLDPIKEDDRAVKSFGIQLAVDMCTKLRDAGIRGFHFYTLNLEKSTRLILEGLKFVAPVNILKAYPWQQVKIIIDQLNLVSRNIKKYRDCQTNFLEKSYSKLLATH